uniref:MAM domain-containing protein n=1 Tax=Caenorhabditis tropicalis TaxID=1561998 RepID=A0A1I7UHH6_9PELO
MYSIWKRKSIGFAYNVGSSEPGLSRPAVTNNNLFPSSVRARGEKNTHFGITNGVAKSNKEMSVSLGVASSPSILDSSELNCSEFDEKCRWRNVDGMFVDELDWYQGSGELDQTRLAVATATNVLPGVSISFSSFSSSDSDGQYAIAATDMIQFPTIKAVLVSDKISCQIGDGEIRFIQAIEKNDPGPVFINIPDQGPVPFQIYIIADHFTFNSENLKGGFAIIDSIEYYARMCNSEEKSSFDYNQKGADSIPLIPLAESKDEFEDSSAHVTVKRESEFDSSFETLHAFGGVPPMNFQLGIPKGSGETTGIVDFNSNPELLMNSMIKLRQPKSQETNDIMEDSDSVSTVCESIVCSFNESETCSNMALQSDWSIGTGPVGNPLTGIKGDASLLPFNENGSYAYIHGPQMKSRLQTPSFNVDKAVTIVFSYYKADKASQFQAILKKANKEEVIAYEAPKLTRNSRRWFRESLNISPGKYDYIAFEVSNLRPNHYVGVDEMFVVDDRRKSFCFHSH